MSGYTKLFNHILESTVWGLSKEARLLWITILVKKDRRQIVVSSIPGLAHAARLTVPETEAALRELMAPDEYSQNKEFDGRRIIKVEDGWFVVSGAKYRDLLSVEERRAYNAQKQAEYRTAMKAKGIKPKGKKKPSPPTPIDDTGTDTFGEAQAKKPEYQTPPVPPESEPPLPEPPGDLPGEF